MHDKEEMAKLRAELQQMCELMNQVLSQQHVQQNSMPSSSFEASPAIVYAGEAQGDNEYGEGED